MVASPLSIEFHSFLSKEERLPLEKSYDSFFGQVPKKLHPILLISCGRLPVTLLFTK